MIEDLVVDQRRIGQSHAPFVVAEMSSNHNQSLERALNIAKAAADAGVDALKLQTYTPETMTLNLDSGDFFISNQDSPWKNRILYELYKQAYTSWEWQEKIFQYCKELKIICFSTPFDSSAVDFLQKLNNPIYKIASFENVDLPLVRRVASLNKPILLSTGMASISELSETVDAIKEQNNNKICLLKCTSSYPSSPKDSHINTIPHMRQLFNVQTGLSDHTLGIGVALASISLGSTIIEKHFTLCRADGGVDAAFSLEPNEMKQLVKEAKMAWQSLGNVFYGITESEIKSKVFRRSIYVAEDIMEGELITSKNVRCVRPGYGLQPKYYDLIQGKKVNRKLDRGMPMKLEYLFI
ncbi:MAG: pseudaminic acid synthase [Oligoflexia bacterium]|nr:pseudaminic acid synthase [Oligoflexia bacterium]